MDESEDDALSTPQRFQQHSRQALRELIQNNSEAQRRRVIPARPETPTPLPGHMERVRANGRLQNRTLRAQQDLQNSPRRRHTQDENMSRQTEVESNASAAALGKETTTTVSI